MLFELILAMVMVVTMARIAYADDQSPWLWGAVALVLCLGTCLIPIPYLRVLVAGVLTFGAMIGYKVIANR